MIPFEEIIEDLNDVLELRGRDRFKWKSEAAQKEIRARFAEGYDLADFKKVHRTMFSHWKGNQRMEGFLRPSTLYRASKFPGYLAMQMRSGSLSQSASMTASNLKDWDN